MTFSPNTLKSILSQGSGPSNPAFYQIIIWPPPIMFGSSDGGFLSQLANIGNIVSNGAKHVYMSALAKDVNLPGKQLMTTPFTMYGTEQKLPYGIVYDDFNANFICTNSMDERKFFDTWHRLITNPTNNYWHYYDEYTSYIDIIKLPQGLGTSDLTSGAGIDLALGIAESLVTGSVSGFIGGLAGAVPVYHIRLEEAYPVTISSQEMSYDADGLFELNVQFAYRRWRSTEDMASGSGNFNGLSQDNSTNNGSPSKKPE